MSLGILNRNRWPRMAAVSAVFGALLSCGIAAAEEKSDKDHKTTTPIKHLIVLIGENHTFDNIYGTYVPKPGQKVRNLSRGIVDANGAPAANRNAARQFQVGTINPVSYFISTNKLINPNKTAYTFLPTPEAGTAPPQTLTLSQFKNDPVDSVAPFDPKTFSPSLLAKITQGLEPEDLHLLTTGATGLKNCQTDPTKAPVACAEPHTRIPNFASLTNTSFELSGPKLPYDSYTGDMVHRLFHMWQQSDCDVANATKTDPAGCKNDLYPFVGIARGDDSGGNALGFYNVQKGQAPLFKRLADHFTISDNYHQADMGGTGVNHTMLGTADNLFWEQFGSLPAQPPSGQVADPTPKSATNVAFVNDKRFTECGDQTQPGIKPIMDYLKSLPWRPDLTPSNCEAGRFYVINNTRPGFLSNGSINTAGITAGTSVPPSTLRTIGDALNEKNISWAFFGGGYNAAVRFDNGSTDPIDVMIGTNGDFYCDICNPFQYATSIMGNAAQRKDHIKDVIDFFDELDHGRLRAVSYVKPDSFVDGHPASSKLDLFEGMIDKILDKLRAHPELFEETAFMITFDEGGGYWDSGFIQPLDLFGDGPRIPLIVISPFSRGGKVVHSYNDHASVVKFIERNWDLKSLTHRSRDNLHNPKMSSVDPYVPVNMPAVGDLFDMFDFDHDE
jgi:phospholipase C